MPFSLMRRDGDVVVVRERDGKVLGRHKDRKKALRQLRVLFSLEKASFGGDRSAAGRYAAEQRWKGHTKKDPVGGSGKGAKDAGRLLTGSPKNYEVKGVIVVHGMATEDDASTFDFLTKEQSSYDGSGTGIMVTTVGEFRRLIKSGDLDLKPEYQKQLLRNLQDYNGQLVDKPDEMRVAVELGVDAIPVRNLPVTAVRPDEPHTPTDIVSLGEWWNHSSKLGENRSLERQLSENTSPTNKGPVKSGTLRRWEEPYENDYLNQPYCKEIALHAAYLMGQTGEPPPPRIVPSGFRTPSEAMLTKDANDLLASVNQGTEAQPVLWRGLDTDRSAAKKSLMKAQVGDTVTLGLASTSRDLIAAAKYSPIDDSGTNSRVIMRIEEGSKGVSLGNRALYRHDQEVITSGKFQITDVEEIQIPSWQFPIASIGASTESVAPSKLFELQQGAATRLKSLLPPKEYAKVKSYLNKKQQSAAEYEKETVSVKVVSLSQTSTFNPETKEFEPNG